jgi:hypothetical protein
MHDWSLVSISINWQRGEVAILVSDMTSTERQIIVEGFTEIRVPRDRPWGASISINKLSEADQDGQRRLTIQMQSGDEISVSGAKVVMPSGEGR